MMNIYTSKATVAESDGISVLDHTYTPADAKLKQGFAANKYDADSDVRQRMALGVAWRSHCTQGIRGDFEQRERYMADIVQTCMVAAYEQPTSKDTEAVWFRKYRNEDGVLVTEVRESVKAMTNEELEREFLYKHIEKACKRAVKELLDLHKRECLVKARKDDEADDESHGDEFDRITAARVHDEYLRGDGSEWDRLDAMLDYASQYLTGQQERQLELLVEGSAKLSELSSTTRNVLRSVVLGTLHMDSLGL